MQEINEQISTVSGLILERMAVILTQDEPEAKDIKALTGALKELSELKCSDTDSDRNKLTVRFEGETERMSV